MELESILVSHWKLRNPSQLAGMVETIRRGSLLPPIVVGQWEGFPLQIINGHHRAVAYWMAGVRDLGWGDFILLEEPPLGISSKGPLLAMVERYRWALDPNNGGADGDDRR